MLIVYYKDLKKVKWNLAFTTMTFNVVLLQFQYSSNLYILFCWFDWQAHSLQFFKVKVILLFRCFSLIYKTFKTQEPFKTFSTLQNTKAEVERIADFLGLTLAPEIMLQIANKCQFKEMQNELKKFGFVESMYKANLGYGFMRKGRSSIGQSFYH